jgi:hypothetical protein
VIVLVADVKLSKTTLGLVPNALLGNMYRNYEQEELKHGDLNCTLKVGENRYQGRPGQKGFSHSEFFLKGDVSWRITKSHVHGVEQTLT